MGFDLLEDETIRMILSYAGGHTNACFFVFKDEPDTGLWRSVVVGEDLTIYRFYTARNPDVFTLPPASGMDSECMTRMLRKLVRAAMTEHHPSWLAEYECSRLFSTEEIEARYVFGVQTNLSSSNVDKTVEKRYCAFRKVDSANVHPGLRAFVFNKPGNFLTFRTVGIPMAAYACSVALSTRRMLQPLGGPFVKIIEADQYI